VAKKNNIVIIVIVVIVVFTIFYGPKKEASPECTGTVYRTLPTGETHGDFYMTYNANDVTVDDWGLILRDTISGGCTFEESATINSVMLSSEGTSKIVKVIVPEEPWTCTFTGDYNYNTIEGSCDVVSFTTQTISSSGTVEDEDTTADDEEDVTADEDTTADDEEDVTADEDTTADDEEDVTADEDMCSWYESEKEGECVMNYSIIILGGVGLIAIKFLLGV
jgi:hypothetical protein